MIFCFALFITSHPKCVPGLVAFVVVVKILVLGSFFSAQHNLQLENCSSIAAAAPAAKNICQTGVSFGA